MGFLEPINYVKKMKDLVMKAVSELNLGVSIWVVTDIPVPDGNNGYIKDYKCQIKHTDFTYTIDDVPMAGLGLGNNKGIIKYPAVGDFVLVAFVSSDRPYILGTLYDIFTQAPDNIPQIKLNELALVQKENGSIILMKDNNDIVLRSADSTGAFNGAKLRLNSDGSFKLFNKDNYGIECDASGNIKLRGVTVDATQTPGTF